MTRKELFAAGYRISADSVGWNIGYLGVYGIIDSKYSAVKKGTSSRTRRRLTAAHLRAAKQRATADWVFRRITI